MNRREFILSASAAASTQPAFSKALDISGLRDVTLLRSDAPEAREYHRSYSRKPVGVPKLRALCSSEIGVSDTLRWAQEKSLGFAIRSGGHSFEGFSYHPDLVIDLRQMNTVRFDRNAQTVTVGPGAHLGTVARTLAKHNASVPGGICPTVAMSGYTLGGGIGYFGRRDGLLIDQLQSLRMITADGTPVTASAAKNPDLFWACRGGGGGNFGIVTEMTFRTQPAEPMQYVHLVEAVDAVRAAEILFLWQHNCQAYPRHTTLHLRITRRQDTNFLIVLEGLSGWDSDTLTQEISRLMRAPSSKIEHGLHAGTIANLTRRMMPEGHSISSEILSHSHLFNGPVGERGTLDILSDLLNHPNGRLHLNIEPLGGAISDVAPDATAFPHRTTSFVVQSQILLLPKDDRAAMAASNEAMREVLEPLSNQGVYVNYPDLKLKAWGQKYWGDNLPRLKAIKRKYDPDDVFDHAHSLNRA